MRRAYLPRPAFVNPLYVYDKYCVTVYKIKVNRHLQGPTTLYTEYDSSLRSSGMTRVNVRSHSFTCHPYMYPQME